MRSWPPAAAGPPLDPQNWSFQDNLTWSDYKPIPGPDYSDPAIQPRVKKWKVALVADRLPGPDVHDHAARGRNIFGNPQASANSIPRARSRVLRRLPQQAAALNNFQTMNRYWMEDSFGRYGVELVAFGPYRLPDNA